MFILGQLYIRDLAYFVSTRPLFFVGTGKMSIYFPSIPMYIVINLPHTMKYVKNKNDCLDAILFKESLTFYTYENGADLH